MTTEVSRPSPPPGGAAVIVALCFAVAMLEGYDIQAVGVAAPKMVPALHLSHEQTGWVFSASMIGLVIGAMFGRSR